MIPLPRLSQQEEEEEQKRKQAAVMSPARASTDIVERAPSFQARRQADPLGGAVLDPPRGDLAQANMRSAGGYALSAGDVQALARRKHTEEQAAKAGGAVKGALFVDPVGGSQSAAAPAPQRFSQDMARGRMAFERFASGDRRGFEVLRTPMQLTQAEKDRGASVERGSSLPKGTVQYEDRNGETVTKGPSGVSSGPAAPPAAPVESAQPVAPTKASEPGPSLQPTSPFMSAEGGSVFSSPSDPFVQKASPVTPVPMDEAESNSAFRSPQSMRPSPFQRMEGGPSSEFVPKAPSGGFAGTGHPLGGPGGGATNRLISGIADSFMKSGPEPLTENVTPESVDFKMSDLRERINAREKSRGSYFSNGRTDPLLKKLRLELLGLQQQKDAFTTQPSGGASR